MNRVRIFAKAYACGKELSTKEMKQRLTSVYPGSMVQAAKGGSATNELFVEMLAAQTLQAESSGSLLANRPEIDFLLRLAGTTQIARAIREKGAADGAPFLLVAASRNAMSGHSELSKLELPRRSLSKAELDKVEKAALLSAQRG